MKRNSTTKKIISLILTVIMICSCWVFAPIEASAKIATYSIDLPRSDCEYYDHSGIGMLPGTVANGTVFSGTDAHGTPNYNSNPNFRGKNYRSHEFHFLDSDYTILAYCIEPGEGIKKDVELVEKSENDACDVLIKDVNSSATSVQLTQTELKTLLRKVLGYGYQHGESIDLTGIGTNMMNWKKLKTNSTQRNCVSYAIATQILVWEVVLGERDAQFNHVAVDDGYMTAYDHYVIHDHKTFEDNPMKDRIDHYYNYIVESVKNSTPKNDENIAGKTFSLNPNYASRTMEISIPDPNGLLKDVKSIEGIDGNFTMHDGSSLNISIPFHYAKEGKYLVKYSINYQEPRKVNYYVVDGTQDLVASTEGFNTISDTFTLVIEIPHHHEWIPHFINPTCTSEGQICMMCKCGDIYTEQVISPIAHNYKDSAWVIGHKATCTEDGEELQICERCNTIIDSRPIPKTGHNEVWIIETEATADHDGQMVSYCTKCGNKTDTKSFSAHTHEFGYEAIVRDATCVSEGLKGNFCKACGVCYETSTIAAGHSETLVWVTTIQPTCTSAGESTAYCGDCGDIVSTKSVEATGHSSGTWMTSIAAYCGLNGEEICMCDQCGEIIDSRETEALSHDEGVWKIKNDPTCELAGEKVKSCTRCGQVIETESISAIGHDEGVWKIDIEATADLDGLMGRYCTRCSMVLETKEFTLHNHEEGYTTTLLQPTCTRDGEKGIVCKICNAVYKSETVAMLNHDYSEFYTENNGTHSKSCSRCHYVYTENCSCEVVESYEATCTTAGYQTSKCTVCAYTYSDSFVAPYGHTFGKWATEGKSTHMRYCTDCGVMEITKHVWGEYFSNNDGDLIEEGSKTRHCMYCSESQTIGEPADTVVTVLDTTFSLMQFAILLYENKDNFMNFLMAFIDFIKNLF